jgi:short-subunit dehydrogenase
MNKVAVITGANQGLGREIAIKLAQQKYLVVLVARTEKLLATTVADIKLAGGEAAYYVCDISEQQQVIGLANQVRKTYKVIEVLVNNAGIWTDDDLEKSNQSKKELAIKTNLLGQIYMCEAFLPLLDQSHTNRVMMTLSTSGVIGIPAGDNTNWKTYGASKWGLKGYTQAMKESLRATNTQVIEFYPGGFDSNLYANAHRPNAHDQPWMMKTADVADIAVFALTRPDDVYIEQVVVSKGRH